MLILNLILHFWKCINMFGTFTILTLCFLSIDKVDGCREVLKPSLYNNNGTPLNGTHIVRNVNDTLILVCKAKPECSKKAKLNWIIPSRRNRPHVSRPYKIEGLGTGVRLVIENLQRNDTGSYECIDKNGSKDNPRAAIHLLIKGPLNCEKGILCGIACIHERYTCDGKEDCKNGEDESSNLCGPEPCRNKIMCSNGRCIPESWCCNSGNVSCKWDVTCCPELGRGIGQQNYNSILRPFRHPEGSENVRSFRVHGDSHISYMNNPHQYTDLNFLQTTIYAVFGCAILFMLIVTILVVIMQCKLQMRRNWQFQLLNRQRGYPGSGTYHRALNQEDIIDMMADRYDPSNSNTSQTRTTNAGSLLVTYNINNGVQIVGKPVEPPPYTEVARSPPLNQGPPPPYQHPSIPADSASSSTSSSNSKSKSGRKLSKVQASSEPNLTNIS